MFKSLYHTSYLFLPGMLWMLLHVCVCVFLQTADVTLKLLCACPWYVVVACHCLCCVPK